MNRLNILIIEDEVIIYIHIERTLKKLGFKNIYKAKNSKTAIEIAKKNKIDLLFSDIKIEGDIDGIETSKILQNLYQIPVIFITAYRDNETLKKVVDVDFLGYLIKPYRIDELETLIHLAIIKYKLLESQNYVICIGKYSYNRQTKELKLKEQKIELTKKEQLFISLIFSHLDNFVQYEVIDKTVWYDACVSHNTRRTFFYRIKQKLPNLNFKIEKNLGIGLFN